MLLENAKEFAAREGDEDNTTNLENDCVVVVMDRLAK